MHFSGDSEHTHKQAALERDNLVVLGYTKRAYEVQKNPQVEIVEVEAARPLAAARARNPDVVCQACISVAHPISQVHEGQIGSTLGVLQRL